MTIDEKSLISAYQRDELSEEATDLFEEEMILNPELAKDVAAEALLMQGGDLIRESQSSSRWNNAWKISGLAASVMVAVGSGAVMNQAGLLFQAPGAAEPTIQSVEQYAVPRTRNAQEVVRLNASTRDVAMISIPVALAPGGPSEYLVVLHSRTGDEIARRELPINNRGSVNLAIDPAMLEQTSSVQVRSADGAELVKEIAIELVSAEG